MSGLGTRLRELRGSRTDGAFDRRLIAPMVLGSVLNPVNSSMIAVALIPIGLAFGAPPAQTVWLVSSLYLATAIGQPLVGRLVDLYGPRPLYLAGTALVGVAGVLGTLAPSLWVLILARALLGLGTCAGYPAAMFLIRSEAERTGRDSPNGVLTALAVSSQTVAVVGPTLGGLLIGLGGWRAIFSVNIPLSLACLVLGALRLSRSVPPRRPRAGGPGLDLPGIALFAATLSTLLLFLMSPGLEHWYLPVLTVVSAAGLTVRELRVDQPFIDLRVLAGNGPLLATYGRTLLTFVVSYAFLYGYTQWLEDDRGLSPSAAGLVLLPMFLTGIVVSSITGRRRGVRGKLLVGGGAQVAGCAMLLLLGPGSPIWLLIVLAVIIGIPQGLNSLANQNALYYQADPARMGSSAGLLRTFTYLGAIVASAANGVVFTHGADTAGLHQLSLFITVVAALFLLAVVLDRSLSRIGRTSGNTDSPVPERNPS